MAPTIANAAARLAAIVDSSDDAIVSKDLNGTISSWNPAAERLFGYTAEEALGRSIRIVIPEDRQSEEDQVLRQIVRGEKVDHFETVRRRKDGSEVYVSLTVSPVRDDAGLIIGASKIARDITARRRESQRAAFFSDMGAILGASLDYETTLRSIARLSTTVFRDTAATFADYAIVDIADRDGQLRRVAAAHRDPGQEPLLEQARRYAPQLDRSLIARPLRTGQPVFLPRVSEGDIVSMSLDATHEQLMRGLGPRSIVTVPLTARGAAFGVFTVARSTNTTPFDSVDLEFAVEVGRRAAVAVDNARLYAEAQQAVRSRDQVLAIVSHDLRNALGAIAASARLLLVSRAADTHRERRLETITRVCDRMNRLLQDLLDASRLEAGHTLSVQLSPHDIAPLIQDACESYRIQADEKLITTCCQVHDDVPKVAADRDRVLQVLANLVGNAIKFTPEGGTVTITAQRDDRFARVSVTDTGPGIRPQDMAHIFETYWQAARTANMGTGLGLAIAKGIVEAHGGRIWVDSQPGIGATFHFTLPAA